DASLQVRPIRRQLNCGGLPRSPSSARPPGSRRLDSPITALVVAPATTVAADAAVGITTRSPSRAATLAGVADAAGSREDTLADFPELVEVAEDVGETFPPDVAATVGCPTGAGRLGPGPADSA